MSPIDWETAGSHPRLHPQALDPAQLSQLSDVPLPVLLPSDDRLLSAAQVTTGERWYAASMQLDDHTVFIQGTATVHQLPDGPPNTPHAGDFVLSRENLIVNLSFVEYGAAYVIHIECASPQHDLRCTEDDYAIALAESLERAGVTP